MACTAVADVATHDVAPWTRSSALGANVFHGSVFKIVFLQFSKLNCTLASEAKLEIRDPSRTFTMACRGFVQEMRQERHANMAKNSAPVNMNRASSKAYFTKNSSKFQMPLNSKVVCLNICTFFSLGGFELFREILENAPKFQNGIRGLREQKGFELGF
jgi:hypothetical protein